ncbi:MAG: hypothetical protein V4543_11635 [Bacteroidota bacterium]
MKKFAFYLYALAALTVTFGMTSCGDDETAKPAPTFGAVTYSGGTVAAPNKGYTGSVVVTGEAGLKSVEVKRGATVIKTVSTGLTSPYTFTFSDSATAVYDTAVTYTFTATDNSSATSTTTSKITWGGSVTPQAADLEGPVNGDLILYSTKSNSEYRLAATLNNDALKGEIDFVYTYFANSRIAVISSATDANNSSNFPTYTQWSSASWKETQFGVAPASFDYATANQATLASAWAGATAPNTDTPPTKTRITNLAAGKTYVFKNAAGKVGAFQVTTLPASASEHLLLSVKVTPY